MVWVFCPGVPLVGIVHYSEPDYRHDGSVLALWNGIARAMTQIVTVPADVEVVSFFTLLQTPPPDPPMLAIGMGTTFPLEGQSQQMRIPLGGLGIG